MNHLTHMVSSALAASRYGYGTLSTGEALVAALILNDYTMLTEHGTTIADALDRIGPDWAALVPEAARRVSVQLDDIKQTRRHIEKAKAVKDFVGLSENGEPIDLEAELITHGDAPGYRDAYITLNLTPLATHANTGTVTATIRLGPTDSAVVAQSIIDIHRLAWRHGHRPIDADETETRPLWLG